MSFPTPTPGLVIRYAYLWLSEHRSGHEEGVKDRPCAVVLALMNAESERKVVVLPITHSPPNDLSHAVEIPSGTKRRLGLDDKRSWIVLTEGNRFTWPGPDLRPALTSARGGVAYGLLPQAFFNDVRAKWLALFEARRTTTVMRTE